MMDSLLLRSPKHRGLTAESFAQLLRVLHEDRTLAAEKYEDIRQALMVFFTFRGANDPAELADETVNRVAARLTAGQEIFTQNPLSYFYGVARNVWRETLARPITTQPLDDTLPLDKYLSPNPHEVLLQTEAQQAYEHRLQGLETCLQELSAAERDLIIAYYQGTGSAKIENRQALATRFGISHKTLRNKTTKLRQRLSECVRRRLAGEG